MSGGWTEHEPAGGTLRRLLSAEEARPGPEEVGARRGTCPRTPLSRPCPVWEAVEEACVGVAAPCHTHSPLGGLVSRLEGLTLTSFTRTLPVSRVRPSSVCSSGHTWLERRVQAVWAPRPSVTGTLETLSSSPCV